MNKAIVKLYEYRLSAADLAKLNEDQQAVFATLCYSISELNCLQRMSLFSNHDHPTDPEIVAAWAIQANIMLRTISSKLFELRSFLSFSGKYNKTKDVDIIEFGKRSKRRLSELDAHEGYSTARRVRNEAAFHYKLAPTRARIKKVPKQAMRSMYMSQMNGNQFFPFGEEAIFVSLIDEIAEEKKGLTVRETIEEWMDWSILSIRAANEAFLDFFETFIEKNAPTRRAHQRVFWVEQDLVGAPEEARIPIFLRRNEQ